MKVRALHGIVLGRKNHYGSRSVRGTQVAAILYSLVDSAKLAGVGRVKRSAATIRCMSDQEIDSLRALILSDRRKRRGPFSPDVRERVQGYLKKKWRSGASLKQLGEQLGLNDHTVQFWRSHWGERSEKQPKLRRVEVISETPKSERVLTMHGPAGTRIEGLSLDDAAALWRKLS